VFYSRVARNLVGSRNKQCGDDLNTVVGISLPRWSGNAVIVTALAHVQKTFRFLSVSERLTAWVIETLVVKKKTHGFVTHKTMCYTQNETMPKKWKKAENCLFGFWRSLSWGICPQMGAELGDRLFGQNNLFFKMYICVFCGECGCICVISICVADNQLWLMTEWGLSLWMPIGHYRLYGPYLYDYHLYYPAHKCVITDN